jgi:hypothetical protein
MNDAFAPLWLRGRLQRAEREAERIFEMSPALLAVAGFDGYLDRAREERDSCQTFGGEGLALSWSTLAGVAGSRWGRASCRAASKT